MSPEASALDHANDRDDGEFDSALVRHLKYTLAKYAEGHPEALSDALKTCEQHRLFDHDSLDPELGELVSQVKRIRGQAKPRRHRGRQNATLDHVIRHSLVERELDRQFLFGEPPSVRRAAAVVASKLPHVEAEAVRTSHVLVEEADGDLIGDGYIQQHD